MSIQKLTARNWIPTHLPVRVSAEKINEIIDSINTISDTRLVAMTTPLITTALASVSIAEYGDGKRWTTVLTLTNYIIGPLAGAGAAKILVPPSAICVFPAGVHIEESFYASLSLTAAGTAVAACNTALASVIGDGSANATLTAGSATFLDRSGAVNFATASTGGAVGVILGHHPAGLETGAVALNVAGSVKNVFLNAAATWNANNTGNLTATGTIVINWRKIA
jgi:hypothetical protein